MQELELKIIKKIDVTIPDLESDTRIFPLKNADAENLADILSNIYQSNQQGGRQRFFYLPRSSQTSRAGAIKGALKSGIITTLFTDDKTAELLL